MLQRRTFLSLGAGALLTGAGPLSAETVRHPLAAPWAAWKAAHLDPSGRVIDRIQKNASHSEGQGYGMTLAAFLGDRPAFEAMFKWSEQNLAIRDDALLAWRWLPDADVPVPDRNNATDGDLFYAWALLRASEVFGQASYRIRAKAVVDDLVASCIRPSPLALSDVEPTAASTTPGGVRPRPRPTRSSSAATPDAERDLLLLPAAFGFQTERGYTINPSYYMLRAMQELATGFDIPVLAKCARDGEVLLTRLAQDGRVPDWVEVTSRGLGPAPKFSSNSGYEALRVPLFLMWSDYAIHAAVQAAYVPDLDGATPDGPTPTVFEAGSGAVLEASEAAGYRAIQALVSCAVEAGLGSSLPPFDPGQPYYPATLQMFAYLTQIDVLPECFPI